MTSIFDTRPSVDTNTHFPLNNSGNSGAKNPAKPSSKTALVLAGGGARAAYQVGALLAIRDLLPDVGRRGENPFSILCGTSAGAINIAALACKQDDFSMATETLAKVWRNISAGQVYRSSPRDILRSGLGSLSTIVLGGMRRPKPRSLLDNAPLRELLGKWLDLGNIGRSLADGSLHAVSLTASGYTSGESVSFFQALPGVATWKRTHRFGCRSQLTLDHLMASSAIPFVFPAVRINREFFGDGSMRQLAPLSPAIHLGADRILVIGAGRLFEDPPRQRSTTYPTFAQIAGHALSSIFLDSLAVDIERLQRINRTLAGLSALSDDQRQHLDVPLRPIRSLVISPSAGLDALATQHASALPRAIRFVLHGVGAMHRRGGSLVSYLLFESTYTGALIELGYQDTLAMRDEVCAFLAN